MAAGSVPLWHRREVLYLAPDNKVMSAEVSSTTAFKASVPKPLFAAAFAFGALYGWQPALCTVR
jgi:hypothetical protein